MQSQFSLYLFEMKQYIYYIYQQHFLLTFCYLKGKFKINVDSIYQIRYSYKTGHS